jgi:hypothetical protein
MEKKERKDREKKKKKERGWQESYERDESSEG